MPLKMPQNVLSEWLKVCLTLPDAQKAQEPRNINLFSMRYPDLWAADLPGISCPITLPFGFFPVLINGTSRTKTSTERKCTTERRITTAIAKHYRECSEMLAFRRKRGSKISRLRAQDKFLVRKGPLGRAP